MNIPLSLLLDLIILTSDLLIHKYDTLACGLILACVFFSFACIAV